MRLLYVIDSLAEAGAERSLADLAPLLIAGGVDLHVVPLTDRPGIRGQLLGSGAHVHDALGARRAQAVFATRALLRRVRPDLVHTTLFESDIAGRVAARSMGVPVVSSLVNTRASPADTGVSAGRLKAAQLLDRVTGRFVRRFHAVSAAVREDAVDLLRIRADIVDVVHRGRDEQRLGRRSTARRDAVRRSLDVGLGPLVVAIGRLESQKGFDRLLDGWTIVRARHPDAVLAIAGREGGASSELRLRATSPEMRGSVRLLGHRSDTADLLAGADAFALTSRREGLPGSLIEALALEAPAVCVDIPPVREVLGPTPAALVVAASAAAIGEAIARSLDGGPAVERRQRAGRLRFEAAFTIERSASGMLAFYERALA